MAWTTPRTWSANELVTATIMNTHIRDNLNALKSPPSGNYEADEVADYTTTSTSFTDIDATNFAFTLNTNGGDVIVTFVGNIRTASGRVYLTVDVDGSPVAGDDGICRMGGTGNEEPFAFSYLVTGLSAGAHTFKLQWKMGINATATLYAGAGTSGADVHPQFWAREVS